MVVNGIVILYSLMSYTSHQTGVIIVWGFDWSVFAQSSKAFGRQPDTVRVLLTFKHFKSQSISGNSHYTCFILPYCPSIAFE